MIGMMYSLSHCAIPTILLARNEGQTATQWARTYHLGATSIPFIALASGICSFTAATLLRVDAGRFTQQSWSFLAAGVLAPMVGPFTLLFIKPTNDALFNKVEKSKKEGGDQEVTQETRQLVKQWARLSAIRSLLPLVGALVAGFALRSS